MITRKVRQPRTLSEYEGKFYYFNINPNDDALLAVGKLLLENRAEEPYRLCQYDDKIPESIDRAIVLSENFEHDGTEVWTTAPDLDAFFQQANLEIRFHFNEKRRICVVETKHKNLILYHNLCLVFNRLLPWEFIGDKKVTDEKEFSVIKTMLTGSYEEWLNTVNVLVESLGIEKKVNEQKLSALSERFKTFEEDGLKTELGEIERQIETTMNHYRSVLERKRELSHRLDGLKRNRSSFDIAKAFRSPGVKLLEIDGNQILFSISTQACDWAEEEAEIMIKDHSSALYWLNEDDDEESLINVEAYENFLSDIFVERKLNLYLSSVWRLDLNSRNLSPVSDVRREIYRYLPNPHHRYYSCYDGWKPDIVEAMASYDIDKAMLIATACTGSLNFHDATVMEKLGYDLRSRYVNTICVEDSDTGELKSPADFGLQ